MAGGILDPFGSSFSYDPSQPGSLEAMQMRQQIAMAMLKQGKRGYPKNLGEGLTAIGDALGERAQLSSIERQIMAQAGAAAAKEKGAQALPEGDTPKATTTDPSTGGRPRASADEIVPEPDRTDTAALDSPPPEVSPMQRDAALVPTEQPPINIDASGPQHLALTQPPANARGVGSPIAAANLSIDSYNRMPPQLPTGPRSDVAGPGSPMNATQGSQMAELMGGPPGPSRSPYAPTAALQSPDVASDAAPPGMPPGPAVRNAIAATLAQRSGVPQGNPMAAAGAVPSSFNTPLQQPALTGGTGPGSPPEAPVPGDNPPTPFQVAQAGPYQGSNLNPLVRPGPPMPPEGQMPPQVPPPGTPARPVPPAPGPGPTSPSPQLSGSAQFEAPPRIPDPGPRQREFEMMSKDATTYTQPQRERFGQIAADLERKRQEAFKPIQEAYEARKALTAERYLDTQRRIDAMPKTQLEINKLNDDAAQRAYDEGIKQQLGGIPQSVFLENLKEGKANVAGIPSATESIRRARNIVNNDKMFTGPFADTETFLSKAMGSAGFPVDPKATGTEQFQQAMGGILAQARKSIVGPGAQSDNEMRVLKAVTAADAKLTPDTIRAALDAAEKLNLMMALQHQKEVRQFAGETDPNRQAAVYRAYGVPNMADLVPQSSVNKLFRFSRDPQVHTDFDTTYHTPGLSREVLRFRRPQ